MHILTVSEPCYQFTLPPMSSAHMFLIADITWRQKDRRREKEMVDEEKEMTYSAAGHSSTQGSNQLNSFFDLHIPVCYRRGPCPLSHHQMDQFTAEVSKAFSLWREGEV